MLKCSLYTVKKTGLRANVYIINKNDLQKSSSTIDGVSFREEPHLSAMNLV